VVILTLCVSLLTQITARFIRAVVVSPAALYGRDRVRSTHWSAVLGQCSARLQLACGMAVSFDYLAQSGIYTARFARQVSNSCSAESILVKTQLFS
jgi:hypothetical protein